MEAKKSRPQIVKQYEMGSIPFNNSMMNDLALMDEMFLRSPLLSYRDYDLSKLDQVLQDKYFREAIRLASPVFYRALAARQFSEELLNDKERLTLAKYFNRACFRPTPFGSFASFSLIKAKASGPIRLAPLADSHLHMYPDLSRSRMRFHTERSYDPSAKLILNPSLYRLGKCLRYYLAAVGPKGRFRFTIEESEAHRFNLSLYRLLENKQISGEVLESWVMEKAQCDRPAAAEYIFLLLQEQFLFNADQGNMIVTNTANKEGCTVIPGQSDSQITLQPSTDSAYWYAALERPASGGLDDEEARQLTEAVHVQHKLSANEVPQALTDFIRRFEIRFDQQKVPLLLALDPDTGLTYGDRLPVATGDGLLGDVRFPAKTAESTLVNFPIGLRSVLQKWISNANRNTFDPIEITEDMVESLAAPRFPLPNSLSVMFRKAQGQLVIEHTGGASATQLIGRFSLFSEEVHQFAQRIARHEQAANPDICFADVNVLSDTHADNINRRQQIYDHQINVNACPLVINDTIIPLSDLELSVSRGELILMSRALGKRIIPRFATAHNYKHNELPAIRLLGDLQYQGISAALDIDLTRTLPGLHFYPRITYKQVILAAACWCFKREELTFLNIGEQAKMLSELQQFRTRHDIPERITFGNHDQLLVFNLAATDDAALFCRCLQGSKEILIREYLFADHTVVADGRPMAGQFVTALHHRQPVYRPVAKPIYGKKSATRAFRPGSDWLYVKFYCSVPAANELLLSLVGPLVKNYEHRLRCWFFIRYQDPDDHIRFRMRGDEETIGTLLIAIEQALSRSELADKIGRVQYETYQRELERYGSAYINQVETIFQLGSALTLASLSSASTADAFFSRVFEITFQMAQLFFQQEAELLKFVEEVTDSYLAEYQIDKKLLVALDLRYRELRSLITTALKKGQIFPAKYGKLRKELLQSIGQLQQSMQTNKARKRRAMASDLIHMQLNRMFSQEQRRQEMMVYYCLYKYLKSQQARGIPVIG